MANEKRLIDAKALFEFLKEQREKETGAYSKGRNNGINVAIGAIRNEQICPTVDAVVLPCKIGATVYRIYDDCEFPADCHTKMMCKGCDYRNLFIEKQAFCLSMLSQNGELEHPYYRTRKEAESALAKMDGGNYENT